VSNIRAMTSCSHDGFHSGQGRYLHDSGVLRYVVVCDDCHAEVREVQAQEYRPRFDPHGNEAHRPLAA